ncbi:hypothetical protein [Streptomyces montanisoli]|uniref:hypothetical protein n=1 Tax=Streptomyces montanisoli TaxID=2798581 RepID=UPI0024AF0DF5|nr:hypothetical protein [Streptomyces montanisoli]
MGWTVLYIAFGFVALWLLGEVLLQYKARLRWRVLAFVGFVAVVAGVAIPSIAVIVVGAVAFGVGQSYVTLSFRKGFSTGWAIGGRPSTSRRRRTAAGAASDEPPRQAAEGPGVAQESPQEQTMVAAGPMGPGEGPEPEQAGDATGIAAGIAATDETVYSPQPLPDDTGQQYGVYDETSSGAGGLGAAAGYDPYGGYEQPLSQEAFGTYAGYDGYAEAPAAQEQQYGYAGYADAGYGDQAAGYGTDQQQQDQYAGYDASYAAYGASFSSSYGADGADGADGSYGSYGTYGSDGSYGTYGGYGYPQQYQDPYATDTPPGGVWVPQQREGAQGQQPGQDGYGQDHGYAQPHADLDHQPESDAGGNYPSY